jgi:hypothetical protein
MRKTRTESMVAGIVHHFIDGQICKGYRQGQQTARATGCQTYHCKTVENGDNP